MKKEVLWFAIFLLVVSFSTAASAQNNPISYLFSQSLSRGMENPDVQALQEFLISQSSLSFWPSSQEATRFFGTITQKSLARYQTNVGISPALGYFGPITRKYVNAVLQGGNPSAPRPEANPFPRKPTGVSITITNPTADSILKVGETYTIKWDSQNLPVEAKKHIYVSLMNGGKGYQSIATNIVTDSSVSWKVPTSIPSGTYQISVSCYISEAIYCPNASSDFFKIIGTSSVAVPSITVISPASGEVWEKGKSYEIRWIANNFPYFEEINKLTGKKEQVTPSINTITYLQPYNEELGISGPTIFPPGVYQVSGSQYTWTIPKDSIFSGGYRIKINCPQSLVIYGCKDVLSPIFQIVDFDPSTPNLIITSPNAGGAWTPNSNYNTTWTSKKVPTEADITIILTNTKNAATIATTKNSGNANFTVPATTPPGKYILLLRTFLNDKYVEDRADSLITIPLVSSNTVDPSQQGEIKITYPVASTPWKIGTSQIISWTRALEEIDYSQHQMCEGAYLAVVDSNNGNIAGYIDYLNTMNQFNGKAWWVGTVITNLCGSGTSKTLQAGNYKIRLSYFDPDKSTRVETNSETITLTQ